MRRSFSLVALVAVVGVVLVGTPSAAPPAPKGDITAVLAGSGIKVSSTPNPPGDGSTGDVTVSLRDCASGQVLKSGGPGTWSCAADATGGAAVEHFTNTSSISVPCHFEVFSNANAVICNSTTPSVFATWQQPAGRAASGVFTLLVSVEDLVPAGLTCNDPTFGNSVSGVLRPNGGGFAVDSVSSVGGPSSGDQLSFAIRYSSVPTSRALAVEVFAQFFNCTGGDPSAVTSITVPASAFDVMLLSG